MDTFARLRYDPASCSGEEAAGCQDPSRRNSPDRTQRSSACRTKNGVTCYDLASDPLLLPKSGTTRTRLNAWLEPVEDEIHISMELDSTEMMKQFVMAGLGISFLAVSNLQ